MAKKTDEELLKEHNMKFCSVLLERCDVKMQERKGKKLRENRNIKESNVFLKRYDAKRRNRNTHEKEKKNVQGSVPRNRTFMHEKEKKKVPGSVPRNRTFMHEKEKKKVPGSVPRRQSVNKETFQKQEPKEKVETIQIFHTFLEDLTPELQAELSFDKNDPLKMTINTEGGKIRVVRMFEIPKQKFEPIPAENKSYWLPINKAIEKAKESPKDSAKIWLGLGVDIFVERFIKYLKVPEFREEILASYRAKLNTEPEPELMITSKEIDGEYHVNKDLARIILETTDMTQFKWSEFQLGSIAEAIESAQIKVKSESETEVEMEEISTPPRSPLSPYGYFNSELSPEKENLPKSCQESLPEPKFAVTFLEPQSPTLFNDSFLQHYQWCPPTDSSSETNSSRLTSSRLLEKDTKRQCFVSVPGPHIHNSCHQSCTELRSSVSSPGPQNTRQSDSTVSSPGPQNTRLSDSSHLESINESQCSITSENNNTSSEIFKEENIFKGEECYQTSSSFSKESLESIPESFMSVDNSDSQSDTEPQCSTATLGEKSASCFPPGPVNKDCDVFNNTSSEIFKEENIFTGEECYQTSSSFSKESLESIPESLMLLDNNDLDKFSSTSEMFKGEEYYQTFSSFSKECLESIPENLMLFDRTDFQSDPKPTSSTTSSGPEFHLPKKSRKSSLSEAFKRTREIYLQKMNEAKLLESARCYEASPLNESAESLPQSVMLIDSSDPQSATGPQCSSFAAFTPGLEVQYKNNIPSHMITDNFPFD